MVNRGPFCDGKLFRRQSTHFLFGMRTSARPFRNDILARLIVGCESKGDTGKGGTKVDTDNKLRFVAIGALDLDSGIAILVLAHRRLDRVADGLLWGLHAIPGGWVHGLLVASVLHRGIGVERGGVLGELAGDHGTCGSLGGEARGSI